MQLIIGCNRFNNFYLVTIANLCLFFFCLTFEKADCSIFALLVGRSVGVTINFFQYIQAYKPFTNPVPLHTSSTNLYWFILRIGASIRDLHCLLGLVFNHFHYYLNTLLTTKNCPHLWQLLQALSAAAKTTWTSTSTYNWQGSKHLIFNEDASESVSRHKIQCWRSIFMPPLHKFFLSD